MRACADLVGLLHDLAKHDDTIAVQECNARKTLAVLEGVDDERLLRGEVHLENVPNCSKSIEADFCA